MKTISLLLILFGCFSYILWDKRELADSITKLIEKHGEQIEERISDDK